MQAILDRHGVEAHIRWSLSAKPFLTPPGRLVEALAAAIRAVRAADPELLTTGGTSDGRFIADICREVVEFGPVNASIHAIDEHVRVDDIEALADIYRLTLDYLLTRH